MTNYIPAIITIVIIILWFTFIKSKFDDVLLMHNNRIEILEKDLTREMNLRWNIHLELIETQRKTYGEDIKRADELIRKNYPHLEIYKTEFMWIDNSWFLKLEYYIGADVEYFKVNPKTNTIIK